MTMMMRISEEHECIVGVNDRPSAYVVIPRYAHWCRNPAQTCLPMIASQKASIPFSATGSQDDVTELVVAEVNVYEIRKVGDCLWGRVDDPPGYVCLRTGDTCWSAIPKEDWSAAHAQLHRLAFKLLTGALANFMLVPAAYACVKRGSSGLVYAIVLMQAFLGTRMQPMLLEHIGDFLHSQGLPHYANIVPQLRAPVGSLLVPTWAVVFFMSLGEYVDPTFDAATAANAAAMLSAEAEDAFENSWLSLPWSPWEEPLVRRVVSLQLPGILTCLVAFATLVQLLGFVWSGGYFFQSVRSWPAADDASFRGIAARSRVWGALAMMGECASLSLLSEVAKRLLEADVRQFNDKNELLGDAERYMPPGCSTYAKALTKAMFRVLIEAVPSSWFAISLLALSKEYALASRSQIIMTSISACTSLLTIGMAIAELLRSIITHWPEKLNNRRALPEMVRLAGVAILLLAWLALTARFVGVFACPWRLPGTSQLSLRLMKCMPLETSQ